jgi:hypothetical protein
MGVRWHIMTSLHDLKLKFTRWRWRYRLHCLHRINFDLMKMKISSSLSSNWIKRTQFTYRTSLDIMTSLHDLKLKFTRGQLSIAHASLVISKSTVHLRSSVTLHRVFLKTNTPVINEMLTWWRWRYRLHCLLINEMLTWWRWRYRLHFLHQRNVNLMKMKISSSLSSSNKFRLDEDEDIVFTFFINEMLTWWRRSTKC